MDRQEEHLLGSGEQSRSGDVPQGTARASTPPSPSLPARDLSREEKWFRKEESHECESIAQREGDRLLKAKDLAGADVAHRIAALIRIRRDNVLEPF
ncbi:MAG TPA: hypothetical protein VEU74_11900 [Gemmatimonadales bacterium]|nr:hypothetical protein [Gemmatimonadales bacterium]